MSTPKVCAIAAYFLCAKLLTEAIEFTRVVQLAIFDIQHAFTFFSQKAGILNAEFREPSRVLDDREAIQHFSGLGKL